MDKSVLAQSFILFRAESIQNQTIGKNEQRLSNLEKNLNLVQETAEDNKTKHDHVQESNQKQMDNIQNVLVDLVNEKCKENLENLQTDAKVKMDEFWKSVNSWKGVKKNI